MLVINVPFSESYDEETSRFVVTNAIRLEFEHSLVSVSKWESFFKKPFLSKEKKTSEELLWYLEAMCLTPETPPEVFAKLSQQNLEEINAYIGASMTATTFSEDPYAPKSNEIITSELVYYWMIAMGIPFECQHWHLSRLMTVIKIHQFKNKPAKKIPRHQLAQRQRDLNARRRAEWGTSG